MKLSRSSFISFTWLTLPFQIKGLWKGLNKGIEKGINRGIEMQTTLDQFLNKTHEKTFEQLKAMLYDALKRNDGETALKILGEMLSTV